MWKSTSIFTSFLLLSFAVIASNGELEIKLISKEKKELEPGTSSNIAIMLINNSDTEKEILLKVKIPEGWNQITDYTSVVIDGNRKKIKILSFFIQETTLVGDYTIDVTAYEKSDNTRIGTVSIPVYVKPRYEIFTQMMNAPDYVFSGDTMTVSFMIKNLSNMKTNIKVDILNKNLPETKFFILAPDSLVFTNVFVSTVKDIIYYTRNSVSLTASIVDKPEIESQTSYLFDVIPSGKSKFDAYTRIPIRASLLFVTDNKLGDRKYGGMFDIRGRGMISKKNMREIDFHLKGPDRQGNPILGQADEYYVKYSSLHSKAILGDNTYRLTDLTEGSRSGRGVGYEHKFSKISVGSFVNFPRFYPQLNRVIAGYGSYTFNEKYSLNIGYLNKAFVNDSMAHLTTVSGIAKPVEWGNIMFEYATGYTEAGVTNAYATVINVNYSSYSFFFNYKNAENSFPGYMTNSRFVSTGFSANLIRKMNFSLNYNLSKLNLALDTMYSNAPFSGNLNLSVGYMINSNHSISISGIMRGRKDMAIPQQFDYREYTARLTLQSKINRLSMSMFGAYGKTINYLGSVVGEPTDVFNANLSLQYSVNKHISLKAFGSYLGNQQYLTTDLTRLFYGGMVKLSWSNNLLVVLQYQNDYEIEDYYRDRSLLSLNARYNLKRKHEFGITVNYNLQKTYLNKTQLASSLNYTYIINVPISKRDDIGRLKGKIVNNGVDNVEGIIFNLAGNIAVTDKNGEFEFAAIEKGTYFIFMDNSRSGLNTIAEIPGPYQVDILPGQEYLFELVLTKSARIEGKVVIEADENIGKRGFVEVDDEIKNLIVEVSRGEEMYRKFTNNDGTFNFNDLRPGQWKLKVYDRGIPKGYRLKNSEFTIDLKTKEVRDVRVVIIKKSIKIKFQKK